MVSRRLAELDGLIERTERRLQKVARIKNAESERLFLKLLNSLRKYRRERRKLVTKNN